MVSPAPSLELCFLPGPQDPPPEQYAVVSCYTGTLQVGHGSGGVELEAPAQRRTARLARV